MGQKVNPRGFRMGVTNTLGVTNTWDSRWFASDRDYKKFVLEDNLLRHALFEKCKPAGITRVEIERSINALNIILNVVRPGVVIGRGGAGMEELKKFVAKKIMEIRKIKNLNDKKNTVKIDLKVEPVKEPNLNAYFVASNIAEQLAKRLPHKRVVNFALEKIVNAGAKGAKIILSGRIAGAEIARRETYKTGSIPLSTLRENIDFVALPALTKSGYVGIKVWICK